LTDLSGRVLDSVDSSSLNQLPDLVCASDILPGWEDEWLIVERERFREQRLLALERACQRLTERGEYSAAVRAGLAAVDCDLLRESARRLLVRAYLADGNFAAALRCFHSYRTLIANELGIEPSEQMIDLVAGFSSP
jgi:DNA-binding SARP family transcriptional activator